MASLAWNMRCRFGIAGLSAKKPSSLSAGVLPSSVNALSPRNATQSGSPTGATVASPSSAPRKTMARKRGSRPSACASFGRKAHANRVPEASSNSRRDGACRTAHASSPQEFRRHHQQRERLRAALRPRDRSRVSVEASGPRPLSSSASGSVSGGKAAGKFIGDVQPMRHAVDPRRFGIGKAVRRRRPPQRLAQRSLRADHAADRDACRSRAGQAAASPMIHSDGGLSLARCGVQDSSALTSVLATSLRSPSVSRKVFASLAISAGGGSSATKCRASFCAIC